VNIPRSSPMEGDHSPTIIRVILLTNHALIQLKYSLKILRFPREILKVIIIIMEQ